MACRGNVDLSLHLNLLIKKEPLHFSFAVQYSVLNSMLELFSYHFRNLQSPITK